MKHYLTLVPSSRPTAPRFFAPGSRRRPSICAASIALLVATIAPSMHAANVTWTGLGGDSKWSTPANWAGGGVGVGGVPGTGDTPLFDGAGVINNDDLAAATTLFGLTFASTAGPFTLNGNSIDSTGGIVDNSLNTETINLNLIFAATRTLNAVTGGSLLIGGANGFVSGAGGITKTGGGTVTFNGSGANVNTYTGATTLNAGTLRLDFTNLTTPTNLINSGSALVMGGGTLSVLGKAATPTSQTFASATFNAGPNVISATNGSGSTATVALGAITAVAGATVQFVGPATMDGAVNVAATGTITTTTVGTGVGTTGTLGKFGNANPSIGAYATVGLYDWASTNLAGAGGVGASPYTIIGGSQVTGFYGTTMTAGTNLDVQSAVTLGNAAGANTVRFNNPSFKTLTFSATTANGIQGILVTPNMGANNVAISGGGLEFIRSTSAGNDYGVLWQNNTLGYLNFSSAINGGRQAGQNNGLVQAGPGTVVYSGANDYELATYLNGGFSVASSNIAFGRQANGSAINLNGGTVVGNANFTLDNAGANKRIVTLLGNGGGLAATAGTTLTVSGVVGGVPGTGALVIGIPASAANGNVAGLLPGSGAGTANATAVNATGTVALTGANTHTGGTIVKSGTVQINGINALGGANYNGLILDGGTLQYAAVVGNGGNDVSVGAGVTLKAGNGAIDVVANNVTLASPITGTGALTTRGTTGILTLSAANTYSGGTTVSSGTLAVTNTTGSGTGSGGVTVSGGTLTGAGTVSGTVTATSGALTPGTVTTGNAGTGVLTVGNLTLSGGTAINFGLNGIPTNNYINTGNLTLPATGTVTLSLYQPNTVSPFAAAGIYDLFKYTTLTAPNALGTYFTLGTPITGFSAGYGISGGYVQLTLTAAGVVGSWTNGNGTGKWSESGNWSGGVPSNAGDSATFALAPGTVTLDANKTVGGITFDNAAAYAIVGGNTLTLDNNGAGVPVVVTTGTHDIQTAVAFNDNVTVTPANGMQLTVSGNISQASGTRSLTKAGLGTLVLSGSNNYSGGTFVSNGTLTFNSLAALGAGSTLDLGSATTNGTLKYASLNTADDSSLTVTLNAGGATIDTNGNDVIFATAIGNGGAGSLTKSGSGSLTLSSVNTYTGATTVNGGTLSINSNAGLGTASTGAALTLNVGKLASTATFGLFNGAAGTNDRAVSLGVGGGTFAPTVGTTLTVSGAITGGHLTKVDNGQLTIVTPVAGQNTFSGGTLISAGTILLGDINAVGTGLGNGPVTLDGGTLSMHYQNGPSTPQQGGFANNLVVDTGFTGTLITGTRQDIGGTLTGGGTFNYQTDYVRAALTGNWSAFTGQINVTPNTNGGDFRINTFNGFGVARINLANGVTMYMQANFGAGGLTDTIGELSGGTTAFLRGGTVAGRIMTWSVGGANTNAQFDGTIQDAIGATAIAKVGTGSWTLTGTNTYSNITTVTRGIVNASSDSAFGLSTSVTGGLTLNPVVSTTATVNFTSTSPAIASLANTGAGASSVVLGDAVAGGPTNLTVGGNGITTAYSGALGDLSGTNPLAVGSVTKVGAGTLTLSGVQTYKALNANGGAVVLDSALGTGASIVNVAVPATTVAIVRFGVSQTLAELNIGNGGAVIVGGPPPAPAPFAEDFGGAAADLAGGGGVQAVPEPGSAALLLGGMLTLLGLRRRA